MAELLLQSPNPALLQELQIPGTLKSPGSMDMDMIEHKFVEVNGVKLHVAEAGSGSHVVLFCHGFPESWYSWRHQLVAVAKAGYRAIAFDYRGYGLSDPPPVPEEAKYIDFINDVHSLLDVFAIPKVWLISKEFGSRIVHMFSLLYPSRLAGTVSLGIPFVPPVPPSFSGHVPEGFYMSRLKEAGRAEADFGRFDAKTVVRRMYILFSRPESPIAKEGQELLDMVDSSAPLPSWFSEEDLEYVGGLYEKSRFRTALKVPYRSRDEAYDIPESAVKIDAPFLHIQGEKDYFFKFPGLEEYIRKEVAKVFVPNLETVLIPEGTNFIQEQFPDQVNELIVNFLKRHC